MQVRQVFRAPNRRTGLYRANSLIRKRQPLGPYRRPMSRVLRGSSGGLRFLMGEVPLQYKLGQRWRCSVGGAWCQSVLGGQGYLAFKKQPPHLGPKKNSRLSPTVGSWGGLFLMSALSSYNLSTRSSSDHLNNHYCFRVNMAPTTQPRPDSGLGFLVTGLEIFCVVPSSLGCGRGVHPTT